MSLRKTPQNIRERGTSREEEVTVDREEFNRNLQKLIHAKPLPQGKVKPAKRKPAKIIQAH